MERFSRWTRRLAVALAATTMLGTVAQAQILDFESGGSCYAQTCQYGGFDFFFESSGWAISNDGNGYFNRSGLGSNGLAAAHGARYGYTRITMTKTGGGAFDFSSFLAAVDNPSAGSPGTLVLGGTYFLGGTVSSSVTIGSSFASYSVTGFNGLSSLSFTNSNGDAGLGIDNLDLGPSSAVPEPSSVLLLASGLLGVGAVARRKKA